MDPLYFASVSGIDSAISSIVNINLHRHLYSQYTKPVKFMMIDTPRRTGKTTVMCNSILYSFLSAADKPIDLIPELRGAFSRKNKPLPYTMLAIAPTMNMSKVMVDCFTRGLKDYHIWDECSVAKNNFTITHEGSGASIRFISWDSFTSSRYPSFIYDKVFIDECDQIRLEQRNSYEESEELGFSHLSKLYRLLKEDNESNIFAMGTDDGRNLFAPIMKNWAKNTFCGTNRAILKID